MAKCKRCARGGTLFHPIKLNADGLCDQCASEVARQKAEETARRQAELEKRREEERRLEEKRREEAEAERQARLAAAAQRAAEEERARVAELSKPFDPPECSGGCLLAYSYRDVSIDCPDDKLDASRSVPPRQKLTFRGDINGRNVEIWHKDTYVGQMRDNKLMDMLQDFTVDGYCNVLPVSRYWTDQPAVDLFYYLEPAQLEERLSRRPGFHLFTLTGNANARMQEDLEFCQPCEPVSLELDDYTGKWLAFSCGAEIGYLPASAGKYMDDTGDVDAWIRDIITKDSGKLTASIMTVPRGTWTPS